MYISSHNLCTGEVFKGCSVQKVGETYGVCPRYDVGTPVDVEMLMECNKEVIV